MKKPFVIHPLLMAIFPTLFLYAQNVRQMAADQIVIPIAVSIAAAIVLWLLFGLLLKDKARAGLATTICLFLVSTYGYLYSLLRSQRFIPVTHQSLIPAAFLAFCACVYFIWRARGDFTRVTSVFNVATAVIVAINVGTVVSYRFHMAMTPSPQTALSEPAVKPAAVFNNAIPFDAGSAPSSNVTGASLPENTESPPSSPEDNTVAGGLSSGAGPGKSIPAKPDIYLIILDEYADPETMQRLYGYDNLQFVTDLQSMGFFVAPDSQMHNFLTSRAVASILNMEYVPESQPLDVTIDKTMHSEVVDFLHAQGYKYVYLGQLYEQCPQIQEVPDVYINYYESLNREPLSFEFSSLLRKTTILGALGESVSGNYETQYLRQSYLQTLDRLEQIPDLDGPKFVYAHIMAAHTPYTFGADGEEVPSGLSEREAYFGQYVFTTKLIEKVVDQILANSQGDPIIIVQSDHGPRWSGDWNDILNAYYLPGDVAKTLPGDISPVNTFRVIFNNYLGGSFALLENK